MDILNDNEDKLIECKSLVGVCMNSIKTDVDLDDLENTLYMVYVTLDKLIKQIDGDTTE